MAGNRRWHAFKPTRGKYNSTILGDLWTQRILQRTKITVAFSFEELD